MRKLRIILAILLCSFVVSIAWAGGMLLWQAQVNLGGNDRGRVVVADRDRVYVAGRAQAMNQPADWLIRAFDAVTGDIVWSDQFDAGGGFDDAFAIALDGGRVFVGGESELAGDPGWLVRAYDAQTGILLWQDRFSLSPGEDFVNSIAAAGGQVVAIGGGVNSSGNEDVIIRAYDAAGGTVLWSFAFGGPGGGGPFGGDDEGTAVVIDGGRVYIAAILASDGTCKLSNFTPFFSGDCDFAIAAADVLTATPLWFDIVDAGGNFDAAFGNFDAAFGIAVRGGRVVASGIVTPPGSICQADSFGETGTGGNCDFFVRAYDADTGTVLWTDQYDRASGGFDQGNRVALDDRRAFVSGFTAQPGGNCTNPFGAGGGGNCDFTVRAYDLGTGVLVWTDQFDLAGGFDSAGAIAVGEGRLVVAGRGQNNNVFANALSQHQDMLVRSYNATTGALLWQDQFDLAGGHDRVSDLAAELSRVVVVGRAINSNGNQDFVVRAYRR